jgi:hypothetical protein
MGISDRLEIIRTRLQAALADPPSKRVADDEHGRVLDDFVGILDAAWLARETDSIARPGKLASLMPEDHQLVPTMLAASDLLEQIIRKLKNAPAGQRRLTVDDANAIEIHQNNLIDGIDRVTCVPRVARGALSPVIEAQEERNLRERADLQTRVLEATMAKVNLLLTEQKQVLQKRIEEVDGALNAQRKLVGEKEAQTTAALESLGNSTPARVAKILPSHPEFKAWVSQTAAALVEPVGKQLATNEAEVRAAIEASKTAQGTAARAAADVANGIKQLETRLEALDKSIVVRSEGAAQEAVRSLQDSLREEFEKMKALRSALETLQHELGSLTGPAAIQAHAKEFSNTADSNARWAIVYAGVAFATAVALVITVWVMHGSLMPASESGTELNLAAVIYALGTKVVVVLTLGTIIAAAIHAFRRSNHNAAVNRHRASAMNSYFAFASAASAFPEMNQHLLTEAARLVYAHRSTGFESTGSSDQDVDPLHAVQIAKALGEGVNKAG